MSTQTVIMLINVATQLASIIDTEVKASGNDELQAAWKQASAEFIKGFNDAYPTPTAE